MCEGWFGQAKAASTRESPAPLTAARRAMDNSEISVGRCAESRFKGVGSGVFEIALRYDAEAYRTVLAVQLGKKIYVLHAFQKKSTKGIKTTKHDVDLINQRYAEAKERAKHDG